MALPLIFSAGAVSAIISICVRIFVGTLIARIIFAFGITFITHSSLTSVMSFVESNIISQIAHAGSGEVLHIANSLGFTSAAKIMMSAYIGALTIRQAIGYGKRIVFGGT